MSRSSEVSPATVNRDLAALRLILNLAIRKEYMVKNPVKEVQFLDEGPGPMRVVSHEEQGRYMAAASPLLRDVATLIVETGMRPEEVFTIRKALGSGVENDFVYGCVKTDNRILWWLENAPKP